jgi:hypothetical protein
MGQKRVFGGAGLAVIFLFTLLSSVLFAQTVQVLDLSPQKTRDRIYASGSITPQLPSSWGRIVGTKDQAENLTSGEVVFVKIDPGKSVKPGDRFNIGHVKASIAHPITKKWLGYLVVVPAEIVILETKTDIVTAKIDKSYQPAFLGDVILSPRPAPPATLPLRSLKNIEGTILLSLENSENITEKEIVFIDRGSRDGIIPGDLFSAYETGFFTKEILRSKERLPLFKVGELVVVSVQEETSTALVTRSSQAIQIGDRVVSGRE